MNLNDLYFGEMPFPNIVHTKTAGPHNVTV